MRDSPKRLLMLVPSRSYRSDAFAQVAARLGIEVVYAVDMPPALGALYHLPLAVEFADVDGATATILDYLADQPPLDGLLAVDDGGTLLAAHVGAALGLAHNAPLAADAARNKFRMRRALTAAGLRQPWFRYIGAAESLAGWANDLDYPLVVKPLLLSGSRGVMRADGPEAFVRAATRLREMLPKTGDADARAILIEEYLPGDEVALDGLMIDGELSLLALFDKPDPLVGPFFEETIYTTPSRWPSATQQRLVRETARAARALGLRHGPVHAELRFTEDAEWLIEIAGRSIGGLCGSILEFGTNICLEELILRHAVGLPLPPLEQAEGAAGVMMIPIPKRGTLRAVHGVAAAEAVPSVTSIQISAPLDYPLVPLPEGESYLGFIFARAKEAATVEAALREAHGCLSVEIEDSLRVLR